MGYEILGKIALITGAASGIGFQYASELFRHGLKGITIVDVDEKLGEDAVRKINRQYAKKVGIFVRADVTKPDEIKNAFASAIDEWKTLDIVINNAGLMKDSLWEKEIAINCNAVVTGSLLAMKYMGKHEGRNGGVVVNISSILGMQVFCGFPVYVGSKHFVLGLTRSFGQPFFYNLTGVKFLTLCPGLTATPLAAESSDNTIGNFDGLNELAAERNASRPSQQPEKVAKCMHTVITQGENGSVWVCDVEEPIYEIDLTKKPSKKRTLRQIE